MNNYPISQLEGSLQKNNFLVQQKWTFVEQGVAVAAFFFIDGAVLL